MSQLTLSQKKIHAALSTNGADLGICPAFRAVQPKLNIQIYDELPSTSTQLWQLLSEGAGAGTVAIAQRQTAGRGQRGRQWHSEPGGLYLSMALEPDWPVANAAQLTSISAWGIATALRNLGLPIDVKWPNDLFFHGQKLGGILTETKLAYTAYTSSDSCQNGDSAGDLTRITPRIRQAVIGVGMNWHNPVPQTGTNLATIFENEPYALIKNKINCLEVLAALVLKGILQGVLFHQQVGNQVFMKVYQDLLTQVGKVVSLGHSERVLEHLRRNSPSRHTEERSLSPDAQPNAQSSSTFNLVSGQKQVNRSGEVLGVTEEGYLKVALLENASGDGLVSYKSSDSKEIASIGPNPAIQWPRRTGEILLIKPGEIHIS